MKEAEKPHLHLELEQYVSAILDEMLNLSKDRITLLNPLADYIKKGLNTDVNLIFICTHNSRRSHLSQIWAQVAASYYGLSGINTYSGGTEATAFNERAVAAIKRAGFKVSNSDSKNPHYIISFGEGFPKMEAFSKTFDDPHNPQQNFAAVMTCSDAEDACPVVPGAEARISLHYEDPKAYDGTDEEAYRYDERCRQIAIEMFYVMNLANK